MLKKGGKPKKRKNKKGQNQGQDGAVATEGNGTDSSASNQTYLEQTDGSQTYSSQV